MKRFAYLIFVISAFQACTSKQDIGSDFSSSERDTLLTNIITIISEKALYASDSTKYSPKFRAEYVSRLPLFRFIHVSKDTLGKYNFLISRPVAGRKDLRRGVIGTFTLKPNSTDILDFEELANTPHFDEKLVEERGGFLFRELVKNGSITEYFPMRQYVEWPDSTLRYDKRSHSWVSTIPGL